MFLARARSLVEKQILNEFQVVRETGQGWKCNLLPFGFVSPVQERLARAPEASHGAGAFLGFLAFREKIDRETPAHRDPRLILANYAADETAAVLRWLASRKRFTPASCSCSTLSSGVSPKSRDSA
jgi:hypothetical protein